MLIMATDPFTLLRFRRREIAHEVIDLRQKIDALLAEDAELESAERVISRFGEIEEPDQPAPATDGKPPGTPTTPNMILALLKESLGRGKIGLEPKEMQISISKRWWPGVKSEDVGPTAWRMWKEGRLGKIGAVYTLPPDRDGVIFRELVEHSISEPDKK